MVIGPYIPNPGGLIGGPRGLTLGPRCMTAGQRAQYEATMDQLKGPKTLTKYLQNLLKDGTSSVIFTFKKISVPKSLDNAKNVKESFFVYLIHAHLLLLGPRREPSLKN